MTFASRDRGRQGGEGQLSSAGAPIESSLADLQLIVPNLHRRYSGVTATNRMVAPKLAKLFRADASGLAVKSGFSALVNWRL